MWWYGRAGGTLVSGVLASVYGMVWSWGMVMKSAWVNYGVWVVDLPKSGAIFVLRKLIVVSYRSS